MPLDHLGNNLRGVGKMGKLGNLATWTSWPSWVNRLPLGKMMTKITVWWLLIGWLTYLHFECLEVFINKQKTQQTIWCGVVVIDRQAGRLAGGAPRGFDQGQVTEPLPRMEILCFFCFGYKPNLLLGIPVNLELLSC